MITHTTHHGHQVHQLPCPGIREACPVEPITLEEPIQPIIGFACFDRRKRYSDSFFRYLDTLKNQDEATAKWIAFSNICYLLFAACYSSFPSFPSVIISGGAL